MTIQTGIANALSSFSAIYETRDGRQFLGCCVDDVRSEMRSQGWKNVSRLDPVDHGYEIVEARYMSGVKAKAYAREVVVARWI